MKKIFGYILAAAALTPVMTGCSDYLDVTDETSVSPDNFPTNMTHVDLLLNSAYAGSHQLGLYGYMWFPKFMYLMDHNLDCFGNYDDRSDFLINNVSTDNYYNEKIYGNIMQWIQFANTAIDACDKYEPSAAENELATLHYMKGQALFFRALAYWHAQIYYELESKADAKGFPIIDGVPTSMSEMMPERRSAAECWQFTIDTLEEAITLLKGHNSDKTRVTEWAAKGLLAKCLMQARRTQEAIPVLEDIIHNSGAQLLDYDTYRASFYADEAHEFNKETLFEIDFSKSDKQKGPWGGFTTGSGMQLVMGPWFVNLDTRLTDTDFNNLANGVETVSMFTNSDQWGNNYVHDGNVKRFGFPLGLPPHRVKNPNYDASARVKSQENFGIIMDPAYHAACQAVRDDKTCDPRLFIGAQQSFFDPYIDPRGRTTWIAPSTEANDLGLTAHYYFMIKKFMNLQGSEADTNQSNPSNIPVIRLADIYLLYAEAIASTNPGTALEYVNKVHRRAYGYSPESASPYDYTSLSSATPAAANYPSDILAHDVIKYERWAEMWGEGQWWFDVRRYEILENEMSIFDSTRNGSPTYMERCYSLPIPKTEIERYNGKLTQNYNY